MLSQTKTVENVNIEIYYSRRYKRYDTTYMYIAMKVM